MSKPEEWVCPLCGVNLKKAASMAGSMSLVRSYHLNAHWKKAIGDLMDGVRITLKKLGKDAPSELVKGYSDLMRIEEVMEKEGR